MIIEFPNYIEENTINSITEQIRPYIPKNKNPSYNRDGKTVNISKTLELQALDIKLTNLFSKIQKDIVAPKYNPQFSSGDSGYEYHLYEPNDICHSHVDGEIPFENEISLIRYASVILHLNTPQDGGELVFPDQNKTIKTEVGKLVIFPPYGMYRHYTTPSKDTREIIVTWFVYDGIAAYRV